MKVTIKNLINSSGETRPYAVAKVDLEKGIKVKAGDYSFNEDNEVFQADQSTCVWCDWKVIGEIAKGIEVTANWSLSRKSVSYWGGISKEDLEDKFFLKASKKEKKKT